VVEPDRRSKWITHRWPTDIEHSDRIRGLQETGSLPFYKRYVAGEFREVWMELAALGDAVWLDPVAADALAVCYETMHRAKTNIEIVVGALETEGYDFYPTVYSPYWRRTQKSKEWIESKDEESQLILCPSTGTTDEPAGAAAGANHCERKQRLAERGRIASSFHEERLGIVRPLVPANSPSWIRKTHLTGRRHPIVT